MKRQILAVLLATLAIFIWNAITWMALPFHGNQLNTLPEAVVETIESEGMPAGSGIYHYPGLGDPQMEQKVAKGPRIPLMVYIEGSTSLFNPTDFLKSLFFNLGSAFLLLLLLTRLADPSTSNVLGTSVIVALLVGFTSEFPQTSWFMFPIDYALVNTIDYIIGFTLSGFIIKKIALNQ